MHVPCAPQTKTRARTRTHATAATLTPVSTPALRAHICARTGAHLRQDRADAQRAVQVRADLVSAGAWERTLMLVVRALPAPAPSGTRLPLHRTALPTSAPGLVHICAGTRPHPRRDSQIRHGLDLSKYDVTRTRAFPLTGEHVRPKSHLQEQ